MKNRIKYLQKHGKHMIKTDIYSKDNLDFKSYQKIAQIANNGDVIAFPTETVYGLGANIFCVDAIQKIYELKNRPKNKALIVHISKIEDVLKVAREIPKDFYKLANRFFPGPLTVILKRHPKVPDIICREDTVAVRMPDNDIARQLIDYIKEPIVGTSANISNEKSPVCLEDVKNTFFNKLPVIIDGGRCPVQIPSTIIDLTKDKYEILRAGSISLDEIQEVLKKDF